MSHENMFSCLSTYFKKTHSNFSLVKIPLTHYFQTYSKLTNSFHFQTSPECASQAPDALQQNQAKPGNSNRSAAAPPAWYQKTNPQGYWNWSKTADHCLWPTPNANWTMVTTTNQFSPKNNTELLLMTFFELNYAKKFLYCLHIIFCLQKRRTRPHRSQDVALPSNAKKVPSWNTQKYQQQHRLWKTQQLP